ncbi:Protein BREAST CANCER SUSCEPTIBILITY 2-like B, partial [Mucuna pruriens]
MFHCQSNKLLEDCLWDRSFESGEQDYVAGTGQFHPLRLSSGQSVVMSEGMENKMMELHNQRCSVVVDGIISEYEKERSHIYYDSDSEGAKIYNMLETTEEPEFLMADMSPEQLSSISAYKAKLKRQSEMEKSIEKALEDAGLGNREVTPLMRLRNVDNDDDFGLLLISFTKNVTALSNANARIVEVKIYENNGSEDLRVEMKICKGFQPRIPGQSI